MADPVIVLLSGESEIKTRSRREADYWLERGWTLPDYWTCRECGSDDGPHFDRSLCGRCDGMHYFCGGCGEQDDLCVVNGVELPN